MRTRVSLLFFVPFVLGACGAATDPAEPTTPVQQAGTVDPIPEGYYSITPGLIVDDVDSAIDFYTRAFGATRVMAIPGSDGKTIHAEVRIGDSIVMLGRAEGEALKSPTALGGTVGSLNLYVADADAVYAQAIAAGAKAAMPLENQFWGDRWGSVTDPAGHVWGIGTAKVVLTDEQMKRAAGLAFSQKAGAKEELTSIWSAAPAAASYKQEGYHDITPTLHLQNAAELLEFYRSGLGAKVENEMAMPNGKLMHAEIALGDSRVMVADEMPAFGTKSPLTLGGSTMFLYMYVTNVDAMTPRLRANEPAEYEEPVEMFWGDRIARFVDPSGHHWSMATRVREAAQKK